jgi:hypothetical protein
MKNVWTTWNAKVDRLHTDQFVKEAYYYYQHHNHRFRRSCYRKIGKFEMGWHS